VHQKIFFISCLLLALFLPLFPRILPVIIIFMMFNWLLSGIYLTTIRKLLTERWRILTLSFASLYLLYIIGMFYTTNYTYGLFDLEVKFSLFIFPVIYATSDMTIFNLSRLRFFLSAFIAGCVAGSLVLLGHAWIVSESKGVPDAFYYTNLAWYFHSSYLAMYYTFGIGLSLYYLMDDFPGQSVFKTISLLLVILYLEALIFLLSSKAGLVTLLTVDAAFVLLLIFKKTGMARIIVVVVIMLLVFFGFSRLFPYAFTRINAADTMIADSRTIQTNPDDGTVARMEIWKVSVGLIGEHFMFGVGTGDVKDVLIDSYRKQNLIPISRKKLNAHNQYLQTFITLGVFGFLVLAATLLVPAWVSLRNRDYISTLFLMIFSINILFESMLEAQAGVIFYALFNALLYSSYRSDPGHNSPDIPVRQV